MPERTKLTQFTPIFMVRDLKAALAHYASLGFATRAYEQAPTYGFGDRDEVGLHFVQFEDHGPEADHHHEFSASNTYLYCEDADALGAEWSRPGIGGTTLPVGDTEYNMREGTHIDPDGNEIRFGSRKGQ
jgi:catechol 2,3-dioxygenase-like lactoylglutathione lyase family enzyme